MASHGKPWQAMACHGMLKDSKSPFCIVSTVAIFACAILGSSHHLGCQTATQLHKWNSQMEFTNGMTTIKWWARVPWNGVPNTRFAQTCFERLAFPLCVEISVWKVRYR